MNLGYVIVYLNKLHNKKICLGFILILILTIISVTLNIPYYRQLLGLIFLIILPGLTLIYIFRLNGLDTAERSILVIGLSTNFWMIYGLILNKLCLSFGYESPLSGSFLVIVSSLILLVMFVSAFIYNNDSFIDISIPIKLCTKEYMFSILLIISFVLIIIGSQMLILYKNNFFLIIAILLVCATIVLINLRGEGVYAIYPIAIVVISFSLLTMYWLRSDHILGHDVHLEYYTYSMTLINGHWSILEQSTLDACLSISLLPAIFQCILDVNNDEQLFKGIYVLLCSFIPLIVFVISKKYIDVKYSFLAAVFYASHGTFIASPGSPRTNICILFVGLVVMVLIHEGLIAFQKRVLSIIFLIGIIFSHYSTAYIFFFMAAFAVIGIFIFKDYIGSYRLNYNFLVIFIVLIFLWYGQIIEAPFDLGLRFIDKTISSMSSMFIEEAKSPQIALIYGSGMEGKPIVSWILWANTWISFILIGISCVYMISDYINLMYRSNECRLDSKLLINRFDPVLVLFLMAGSILLVATLLIPQLSMGYEINRILILLFIIFAPLVPLGGIVVLSKFKINPLFLLLPVIIIAFMGETGALHSIYGVRASFIVDPYSPSNNWQLVHQTEISAIQWLATNRDISERLFSTDYHGYRKLISQGKISYNSINRIEFANHGNIHGYLFLHNHNILSGKLFSSSKRSEELEISNYENLFTSMNKLFTNGGSEIWKSN